MCNLFHFHYINNALDSPKEELKIARINKSKEL
jgi:hypothetical protein